MGGDHAPENIVHGAVLALREQPDITRLFLTGDTPRVEAELAYAEGMENLFGGSTMEAEQAFQRVLKLPSYLPVMQFADNRALRETLYRAYVTRASEFGDAKLDNNVSGTRDAVFIKAGPGSLPANTPSTLRLVGVKNPATPISSLGSVTYTEFTADGKTQDHKVDSSKTILITGASRGIGRAAAVLAGSRGWAVGGATGKAHTLTLITAQPMDIPAGSRISVTLEQQSATARLRSGRRQYLRALGAELL